jgi:hypothetical protein
MAGRWREQNIITTGVTCHGASNNYRSHTPIGGCRADRFMRSRVAARCRWNDEIEKAPTKGSVTTVRIWKFAAGFLVLSFGCWTSADAQNTDLRLEGTVGFQKSGSNVTLSADRVCNRSPNSTSGSVYIGLWATQGPSPIGSGYHLGDAGLSSAGSSQLVTDECFVNISRQTTWIQPPNGTYYVHFYVTEFPNNRSGPEAFLLLDTRTFDELLIVGNPGPSPTDDHGNTISNATSINIGTANAPSRTGGVLEVAGDADVFRFTVSTRSSVVIGTESTIDTVGELLDAFGAVLDLNDDRSQTDFNFQLQATLDAGTYFVRVTGYQGAVTGAYVLVGYATASGGDSGIVPTFTATPTQGRAPLAVTFDAFNTIVPAGAASYQWNFGDGATATGLGATHTYANAGVYTATLTVTDLNGATASTSQQITVSQAGGGGGDGGGGGGGAIGPAGLGLLFLGLMLGWFARFNKRRVRRPR